MSGRWHDIWLNTIDMGLVPFAEASREDFLLAMAAEEHEGFCAEDEDGREEHVRCAAALRSAFEEIFG
jgi:hypothetical protein